MLKVAVYDWDRFNIPVQGMADSRFVDSLIGETTIDIEDRWFHKDWQSLGQDSAQVPQTGPPKPLESRDLMIPTSSNSQGKIYLWLEILPASEARAKPPVTFVKPEPLDIEVRVIVWALNGYSTWESSQDYFVKTYLKGNPRKKLETDTHWRSKTGSAQWNWRHKHIMTVPLDNPEKATLVVELWDRDIFSSNDSLGSFEYSLSDWMKKCYIEQRSIKPFEMLKSSGKASENVLDLGDGEVLDLDAVVIDTDDNGDGSMTANPMFEESKHAEPSPEIELAPNDLPFADDNIQAAEEQALLNKLGGEEEDGEDDEDKSEDEADGVDEGEETDALVPKKKKNHKVEKEPENVMDMLREFAGLPVNRDDAHWFTLHTVDVESGVYDTNGEIMITIELIPKELADVSPVGTGRSEPNANPYLAPPAGRFSIAMNPLSIFWALLTEFPAAVCCCCCCCCLILALGLFMVGGTYISALSSLGVSI